MLTLINELIALLFAKLIAQWLLCKSFIVVVPQCRTQVSIVKGKWLKKNKNNKQGLWWVMKADKWEMTELTGSVWGVTVAPEASGRSKAACRPLWESVACETFFVASLSHKENTKPTHWLLSYLACKQPELLTIQSVTLHAKYQKASMMAKPKLSISLCSQYWNRKVCFWVNMSNKVWHNGTITLQKEDTAKTQLLFPKWHTVEFPHT